jgi:hypothetical protein
MARPKKTGRDIGSPAESVGWATVRAKSFTPGLEYPQRPAVLTAAINEKVESDSHLPRFFSLSLHLRCFAASFSNLVAALSKRVSDCIDEEFAAAHFR